MLNEPEDHGVKKNQSQDTFQMTKDPLFFQKPL